MKPEQREIREAHSTWIEAVNAGDLVRLLTLMADDAVFLNPGKEPFGREGFSANFSAAQQRGRVRCTSELAEVVVVGEVAYAWSRDALSVTALAGGETARLAGQRLTVYRKQPDGRWLLARDAHTLTRVESPEIGLLRAAYAAFNARDIDAALALMTVDVAWPRAFKGGFVHGPQAVGAYWTEQWSEIDPHVEPVRFHPEEGGRTILVEVHQVVRDLAGNVLADERVGHRFTLERGLIRGMEVCPLPASGQPV